MLASLFFLRSAFEEDRWDGATYSTTAVCHIEEAVGSLDIKLSDDEIKALEEPYVPHPVLDMM
ncbi:hypothetical protein SAMN04488121_107201 [Chitinophaga filiformis]|uniref:Aldo/keto reductase family protein n=1 Tax=Chitinophaga filiformis TaxID=104663 RepID=A0A1G7Y4M4_CHIFI|nr:hypothetical protein SAMN04488121_107201 [Chitinophaga filiformis]